MTVTFQRAIVRQIMETARKKRKARRKKLKRAQESDEGEQSEKTTERGLVHLSIYISISIQIKASERCTLVLLTPYLFVTILKWHKMSHTV